MPPFDLEQGKLSVRVSEGVYYQLLADIDDFGFRKSDGSDNANAFFNQLLPNLIAYRIEKRKDLRKYLKNNIIHCIKEFQNYTNVAKVILVLAVFTIQLFHVLQNHHLNTKFQSIWKALVGFMRSFCFCFAC